MVDKLKWLVEHGYMDVIDGVPWTTVKGTSLLCKVDVSRLQGVSDLVEAFSADNVLSRDMRRGLKENAAAYGTYDTVELLWMLAQREETKKKMSGLDYVLHDGTPMLRLPNSPKTYRELAVDGRGGRLRAGRRLYGVRGLDGRPDLEDSGRNRTMNINGVDIDYRFDGAHDARPTEHTLHGLDGLNLSCLDWMRLSHVCRLMAARNRKPKQAFVRVSGWTADRPNMRLIMDMLQDDGETVSVPLPLTSDYLLVNDAECDDLFQYGWLDVLYQLLECVDYDRLDETGMRVVDWLNGMADPSPEIFEDWEAIGFMRQNVYEDEPTVLADLLRSATRTERDECFDMLEQVETGRPL